MTPPSALRLLATTNNERGDLFTRLSKDLFFALGYDSLRLDVHRSGRELDVQGKHRMESRNVVGECKAHATKIGGDALNKFLGVLTRERARLKPTPVAGYFVSLSGFTETGIEQELESGAEGLILLDAKRVVYELEK
ncbi:MAG: restriction endonuclease, partial [Candidatus Binatia bacterium]